MVCLRYAIMICVAATALPVAGAESVHLSLGVRADLKYTNSGQGKRTRYSLLTDSVASAEKLAGKLRASGVPDVEGGGETVFFTTDVIADVLEVVRHQEGALALERAPVLGWSQLDAASNVPFNKFAQITHRVPSLKSKFGVQGKGVGVGLWDVGSVLAEHREFRGRVHLLNPTSPPNQHSTHVAGTIGASGVDEDAQGMAPECEIFSFDLHNDINEMLQLFESNPNIRITSHSYGGYRGWSYSQKRGLWEWYGDPRVSENEDYVFGLYSARSASIDRLIERFPTTTSFVAAGNDRNPSEDPSRRSSWAGRHWLSLDESEVPGPIRPRDYQHNGGFDTLEGFGVAKNVITIGAMNDVNDGQLKPSAIQVTPFSSWGPTDDGRIKPDLIANGAGLLSPSVLKLQDGYDPEYYETKDGTSMATPVAAGIGALLTELSFIKRGSALRSDETKAALIHTAVRPTEGPSYKSGWGAIDALSAGDLVAGISGSVHSKQVEQEGAYSIALKRTEGPLRVTLTWIDPPALPSEETINDTTANLVLDFDLSVVGPDETVYYPWSLDPSEPDNPPTRMGPNHRDNVEVVDVPSGSQGNEGWQIRIICPPGSLGRAVAIAISGAEDKQ